MKHWRHSQGLAYALQALSGHIRRLGKEQPCLGAGQGIAAGCDHQHILFDQLFDQIDMAPVMDDLGIVAAHHGAQSPDGTALYRSQKWVQAAAQGAYYGLHGEAYHALGLHIGDMDLGLIAAGIVQDRRLHNGLGRLHRRLLMKLHVSGSRELGLGGGRDELGVEAAGHCSQRGHDALYVHNHGLHRSRGHGQLLLQEVSCHRHAVAHENLISGAAHSGNIDAHSSLLFGQIHHLRLSCRSDDHLREQRLVAVHYDVDLVGLQHPQVGLGEGRCGGPEEDILQLSGDHGAAPAVGYACP